MKKILSKFVFIMLFGFIMPMFVSADVVEVITQGNEPKMDVNYGWTFNLKNVSVTASDYHRLKTAEEAVEKKVPTGYNFDVAKLYWINDETDCSSGKIYIIYNNIGKYQGKQVNMKVSVTDCKFGYEDPSASSKKLTLKQDKDLSGNYFTMQHPSIMLNAEAVQVEIQGLRSTSLKYEFIDNDGNTLNIKGYGTLQDLDFQQAFKLSTGIAKAYIYGEWNKVCTEYDENSNCSKYEKLTHLKANQLTSETDYTKYVNVKNAIQSSNLETYSERQYEYAWSTILFSGGSFDITYYLGEPDFLKSWWDNTTNNPTGKAYEGFGGGMFRFVPDSLLEFQVEDPVKSVDKKEIQKDEEFTYTTSHRVPYITLDGSNNKYTAYSFTDTLEPCLTVEDVSKVLIKNDEGLDVTDKFNVTMNEKNNQITVSANAKSEFVSLTEFYGHEYEFIITAKVKKDYDLSKYLDKNKENYVIPNTASISVTDNSGAFNKPTNEVDVKIPIPSITVPVADTGRYISVISIGVGVVLIVVATLLVIHYKKKKNGK